MMVAPKNYVQIAYDKAVTVEGNPSQRITEYLNNHFGLATETLFLAEQLAAQVGPTTFEDEQSLKNYFLVMFAMGVIFEQDYSERPSVYIAETN